MFFNEELEEILFTKLFYYLREKNSHFEVDNVSDLIKKCIVRVYSNEMFKIEYNFFISICGYDLTKKIGDRSIKEIYELALEREQKRSKEDNRKVFRDFNNDFGWYIIDQTPLFK